jgi:hypothetical protein
LDDDGGLADESTTATATLFSLGAATAAALLGLSAGVAAALMGLSAGVATALLGLSAGVAAALLGLSAGASLRRACPAEATTAFCFCPTGCLVLRSLSLPE